VSHSTARPRQADTSFVSQNTMIGRQFESDPAGAPRRYENPSRRHHNTSRQLGRVSDGDVPTRTVRGRVPNADSVFTSGGTLETPIAGSGVSFGARFVSVQGG